MRPDPEKLFFIVGTGRCGTTLLQAMLSCHPRLYIPPELRYFGRHEPRVGFSEPLRDSELTAYLALCEQDIWWQDMGLDHSAFEEAVRGGVRSSRQIYLWLLEHIGTKRGNTKPRYGEKTPYNLMFTEEILRLFPGAKFIHLFRDPRDVATSYMEQYWCAGRTALRTAAYLTHVLQHASRLERDLGPDLFLPVKYEDLVAEPERELRRLCRFLGEEYTPEMLDYGNREDAGYLEVEEGWKGLTREPLTASRIGRYAQKLAPHQIWTLEHYLGPLLSVRGYVPTRFEQVPLSWYAGFWAERVYRKAMRAVGKRSPLLDEQAILARRNEIMKERVAAK